MLAELQFAAQLVHPRVQADLSPLQLRVQLVHFFDRHVLDAVETLDLGLEVEQVVAEGVCGALSGQAGAGVVH